VIALLPWGLPWALLWGPGCQPGGEDSGAVEVGEVAFSVAPEAVDFGAVPLGESAWQTIVITNEGGADLTLAAAELSQEAGFFLNTGGNAELAPGEQQSVFVAWTPEASGSLEATLSLRLEGSERLVSEVALTGSGAEALPGLSVSSVDFGVVGVGCEVTAEVRVSNDGALPAEVVALRLDDSVQDDSTLDDVALEAPALPVTLEPGGGLDLTLRFAPGDVGVAEGALEVDVGETLSLPLRGEGAAGEAWEEDFVVSGDQPVSLLIAINGEITVGRFGERLEDALPDLYDTLAEAGVPWRVAWLVLEEGSVVGETAYIDDGFSTDAAVAATLGMLVGADDYDNDYLFSTLYSGMLENRGWLLDDPGWADSRLNLVGIGNDLEQSPVHYVTFLNDCGALKEGVVVHAIGGPWPEGCEDATPYAGFYEATLETGGVFLDYCEPSWRDHMETLALGSLGGNQSTFTLSTVPTTSSLEVVVDGSAQQTGWSYNAALNAVVFDRPLERGAAVQLRYLEALECIQ